MLALTLLLATGAAAQPRPAAVGRDSALAATFLRLSEPAGYFDSDNLISNETSYLHVATRLEALGVRGGAYIGVGPDQNYSYLAIIRPAVAFLVDIRRDNALQHLLFRALFLQATSRLDYLCLWLGCRRPSPGWEGRPVLDLLAWVDSTRLDSASARAARRTTARLVESFGVPLDTRDRETLERFHARFMQDGLALRFESFGRVSDGRYPTLRRLVLERDLEGRQRSYLATEDAWRLVQQMHREGRIIPVVGDLGGRQALPVIAREVRARGLVVSAIYTSNAELYLWRDQRFATFARTVGELPVDARSVIVRSLFDRGGSAHPLRVPGHLSVQLLQRVQDFNRLWRDGALRTYADLVTRDAR